MSPPAAILVLGMHRSGTSALAGCLDILGVPLGAPLLPANDDNERGYFEHAEVVAIHDELLGSFEASALDLTNLPAGWASEPAARKAEERLHAVLLRDFGGKPLWGVKDPRLCLFLPLWESVLREVGVEPRFALILRSPWEVARSLEARNGLETRESLNLWVAYTGAAERATRGRGRAVTTFDRILASPESELSFLATALEVAWPTAIDRTTGAELRAFLEPSIRHWKRVAPPEDLDPDLVDAVEGLHGLTEGLRDPAGEDPAPRIEAARSACVRRLAALRPAASRAGPSEDEFRVRWLRADTPDRLTPGQWLFVDGAFAHEGERPLSKRGLSISYHWVDAADPSKVVVWDGLRTPVKRILSPGESYKARIVVRAPLAVGRYRLLLDLVREGVAWFGSRGSRPAARSVEVRRPITSIGRGHFELLEKREAGWLLAGWVLNPDTATEYIRLESGGVEIGRTEPSVRPDVAGALPWVPHAAQSGFTFRTGAITRRRRVDVVAVGRDGEIARLRTTLWPDVDQLTLPQPELVKRVTGSPEATFFLADGLRSVTEFVEALRHYRPEGRVRRTLDWGCGCGRLAMHFRREAMFGEVFGCDIDREAIRWCASTLDPDRFLAVEPLPPTPFAEGFFDLVVGYSVFTHLAPDLQKAWLGEIRRILAPGGLVLASVHGPFAARFTLAGANAADPASPVWRLLSEGFLDVGEDPALRGVGPPNYYRGVYQTAEWTRREWSPYLEILDIVPGGTQNYQDLVVMRRTGAERGGAHRPPGAEIRKNPERRSRESPKGRSRRPRP